MHGLRGIQDGLEPLILVAPRHPPHTANIMKSCCPANPSRILRPCSASTAQPATPARPHAYDRRSTGVLEYAVHISAGADYARWSYRDCLVVRAALTCSHRLDEPVVRIVTCKRVPSILSRTSLEVGLGESSTGQYRRSQATSRLRTLGTAMCDVDGRHGRAVSDRASPLKRGAFLFRPVCCRFGISSPGTRGGSSLVFGLSGSADAREGWCHSGNLISPLPAHQPVSMPDVSHGPGCLISSRASGWL